MNNTKHGKLLIGLTGHSGVGKDEATYLIRYRQDVHVTAFAIPLKKMCATLYGIPQYKFFEQEHKEVTVPEWNKSPREILQYVGTELVRNNLGAGHWIKLAEVSLQECTAYIVAYTDVRFQNEADWILSNGGYLIKITRPGYEGKVGIANHSSESGISMENYSTTEKERIYYVENSTDLSTFRLKMKDIYASILFG